MPKVKPGLIEAIGATKAVNDLIQNNTTDPSEIADTLNQEPTYKALVQGEGRKSVTAEDIRLHLKEQGGIGIKGNIESDSKALQESPRAQALVQSVKDRVTGLIHKAEAAEYILDGTMRDVERLQRKWRDDVESGTTQKNRDGIEVQPDYPVKEITALCRIVETQLKMVSAIKGDDKITQLMKANQVTVNQGISQDEVFDTVFGVCDLLGHSKQEVLAAYSDYMSRGGPIDAEIVEADGHD